MYVYIQEAESKTSDGDIEPREVEDRVEYMAENYEKVVKQPTQKARKTDLLRK